MPRYPQSLRRHLCVAILFLLLCPAMSASAQQDITVGKTRVPDFPAGSHWLNVSRPLSLQELRGHYVLLDFWTYCCINCMHVLPDLQRLEDQYPELQVIGVHSAKFRNEQDRDNVRQAILRYNITHPVLLDNDLTLWHQYAVNAWPSFVLIDPQGYQVAKFSGEGVYARLQPVLDSLIAAEGAVERPAIALPLALERHRRPDGYLSFPGKVVADEGGKRLFFTDSNHNRILEVGTDGTVQRIIGSGLQGKEDGMLAQASFFRPQGLAYDAKADVLYVADTENHLIRKVDLRMGEVTTLLGTGQQAQERLLFGQGTQVALNSPWDLSLQGDLLMIAMAGSHQLWQLQLSSGQARVFAGNGWEALRDGPLASAQMAQPSGLANDGKGRWFVMDSEASAIRMVADGQVNTLVGSGLFDFGDVDGLAATARLQHPLGVNLYKGKLYVADTYNHKLKAFDLKTNVLQTIAGTGTRGLQDGPAVTAQLNEPSGLCWLGGRLYFTDTNNGLVRYWDPKRNVVQTLELKAVDGLSLLERQRQAPDAAFPFYGQQLALQPQPIDPKAEPAIEFKLVLPDGYKLNRDAPNYAEATDQVAELEMVDDRTLLARIVPDVLPEVLELEIGVYFCDARMEARCFIKQIRVRIPLQVVPGTDSLLQLEHQLDIADIRD